MKPYLVNLSCDAGGKPEKVGVAGFFGYLATDTGEASLMPFGQKSARFVLMPEAAIRQQHIFAVERRGIRVQQTIYVCDGNVEAVNFAHSRAFLPPPRDLRPHNDGDLDGDGYHDFAVVQRTLGSTEAVDVGRFTTGTPGVTCGGPYEWVEGPE